MPIKRMVMMLVAVCVTGFLTGCGVPKDEHEAVLAELNDSVEQNAALEAKLQEREAELQTQQSKVKGTTMQLEDARKRITELEDKESATAQALENEKRNVSKLESDLEAARSATGVARNRIGELESALAALQDDYAQLQNRFSELKKNMLTFGRTDSAPVEAPEAAAPMADEGSSASDAKTAMDLLDEMGTQ